MKVHADEDKCVSGGQCVMAAPMVFDQRDEDGVVVVLESEPDHGEEDNVRRAVVLCPSAALWVTGG